MRLRSGKEKYEGNDHKKAWTIGFAYMVCGKLRRERERRTGFVSIS